MDTPRVAVASLGGTITMTSASGDGMGVRPALDADELISAIPGLTTVAELTTATLSTLPGASLTFAGALEGLDWAASQIAAGADGAVLIQGTDTIEETSYLLDLHWDLPAPLIVTGAMRPAQAAGADGPANLLAAVHCAADRASRGRGVLVVLNDEIHAATRVRKTQASGLGAFSSPGFGPLGYFDEQRIRYAGAPAARRTLRRKNPSRFPRVAVVEAVLGDRGDVLDAVVEAGFDGVVLAGFGVGHVPAAVVERISAAAGRIPVVLASRTGSRRTHQASYSFPGSESDLIAKGVIPSGWLDARKARVLLACLLAAGSTEADIRAEFAYRG